MVYSILKITAKVCFTLYHRKVYFIDPDKLPAKGPVLLCLNHPGAFFDACIIATYSKRPLHFLTRGDLFKEGIADWFLRASHQIPIFRAEDGMRNLRSNLDTFSTVHEYLHDGKIVLIFPEARTALEKRLRPLHKGAARIALGMQEVYPGEAPMVVPVGVTMMEPREFRRDSYFKHGELINPMDYLADYNADQQLGLQRLTDAIEEGLKAEMIYLDDEERENLFDDLVILYEPVPPVFPQVVNRTRAYFWNKGLASTVNGMDEAELAASKESVKGMRSIAEDAGIPLRVLQLLINNKPHAVWILLSSPLRFIGGILEFLPVYLVNRYILSRVKRQPFIAPLKAILGFFLHLFYYLLIIIILSIVLGSDGAWIGLGLAGIVVFSLYLHRAPTLMHYIRWVTLGRDKKQYLIESYQALQKQVVRTGDAATSVPS